MKRVSFTGQHSTGPAVAEGKVVAMAPTLRVAKHREIQPTHNGKGRSMKGGKAVAFEAPVGATGRKIVPLGHMSPEETGMSGRSATTVEFLLLYEDVPTALRARQVIDRLKATMDLELGISVNPWRLETLKDPLLREIAMEDARRATMVFVSIHGDREFHPVIRAWLDAWLAAREMCPGALILSLDADVEDSAEAEAALTYVNDVTAPFNVEVFPHFDDPPQTVRGDMFSNNKGPRLMVVPAPEGLFFPPEPQLKRG